MTYCRALDVGAEGTISKFSDHIVISYPLARISRDVCPMKVLSHSSLGKG
jgi:hypothetical protein